MMNAHKKPMRKISLSTKKLGDSSLNGASRDTRLIYFLLYLLAGECNAKGYLIKDGVTLNMYKIAHYIHTEKKILSVAVDELKQIEKISVNAKNGCIKLIEFNSEQGDIDSKREKARLRQAAHRYKISTQSHATIT